MADNSPYLAMLLRVFDDLVTLAPLYSKKESSRDISTVRLRLEREGFSFVSKTLPALGKELESSLASGTFKPSLLFKKESGRTTPCFLRSLFKEIFDANGFISGTPSVEAVKLIRQVCYFIYKLEDEYSQSTISSVLQTFEGVDRDLRQCEVLSTDQSVTIDLARSLLGSIFNGCNFTAIAPRPGPGSTACGTHPARRYEPHVFYANLDSVYRYSEYFYCHEEHEVDRRQERLALPIRRDGVSKITLVPKDSRGPRIICMEPHEYMWFQQGVGSKMRKSIERSWLAGGQVNFEDQTVNQRLAISSSLDGRYATLDMKEASDRISRVLVDHLFKGIPTGIDAVDMSTLLLSLSNDRVEMPDGAVVRMNKFAPMGSALCFPTMSIVHFALAVALIQRATLLPTHHIAKEVYVYGDDIIVPSQYAQVLFDGFPSFGLRFNQGKSFSTGQFRESCGADAFQGRNVTPIRLKSRFLDPGTPSERATKLMAARAMEWSFRSQGFHAVATYIRKTVERQWGELPLTTAQSPVCGWISDPEAVARQFSTVIGKMDQYTQQPLYRQRLFEIKPEVVMLDNWERLLRTFVHAKKSSRNVLGRRSDKCIVWRWVPKHLFFDQLYLPGQRLYVKHRLM